MVEKLKKKIHKNSQFNKKRSKLKFLFTHRAATEVIVYCLLLISIQAVTANGCYFWLVWEYNSVNQFYPKGEITNYSNVNEVPYLYLYSHMCFITSNKFSMLWEMCSFLISVALWEENNYCKLSASHGLHFLLTMNCVGIPYKCK